MSIIFFIVEIVFLRLFLLIVLLLNPITLPIDAFLIASFCNNFAITASLLLPWLQVGSITAICAILVQLNPNGFAL
jgi:hypothetical protein